MISHKNHCKFGYNNEAFNFRKNPEDQFYVEYGSCERVPYSFRKESVETAKLIYQYTNLPIYILFSGGIDSEITIRCFMEANVPFTCVIIVYDNLLNAHDVKYAFDFCKDRNIKYEIINLNILDFWENDLSYYAEKTYCVSPQPPVLMKAMDEIDGYVILSLGTSSYVEHYFMCREVVFSLHRYFLFTGREGTPSFFTYTPELMLSFLNDIKEKSFATSYYNYMKDDILRCSFHHIRNQVYDLYWNKIDRLPYNGFEKIIEVDKKYRKILKEKYVGGNCFYKIKIDELERQLKENI